MGGRDGGREEILDVGVVGWPAEFFSFFGGVLTDGIDQWEGACFGELGERKTFTVVNAKAGGNARLQVYHHNDNYLCETGDRAVLNLLLLDLGNSVRPLTA